LKEEEEGLKEVGTGLGNLKLHIDKQTDTTFALI
jgi:hypothetical protein